MRESARLRRLSALRSRLCAFGPGILSPRTQHRQGFHAQVHAHGVPGLLHRLYVLRVHRDRGEPPVGLARHRHPLRHAEEAQFLAHPHPADDRQAQAPALHAERPGLVGRTEARAAVPALEPGIARPLREERPERHAQIDHGLLGGTFRHVIHPRELGPLAPVEVPAQRRIRRRRHGRVGLPGLILPAPLCQRPVPGEAGHARGPQEIAALHIRRLERDAVRNQHDADSSTARATPSSNFRFLCDRLP